MVWGEVGWGGFGVGFGVTVGKGRVGKRRVRVGGMG